MIIPVDYNVQDTQGRLRLNCRCTLDALGDRTLWGGEWLCVSDGEITSWGYVQLDTKGCQVLRLDSNMRPYFLFRLLQEKIPQASRRTNEGSETATHAREWFDLGKGLKVRTLDCYGDEVTGENHGYFHWTLEEENAPSRVCHTVDEVQKAAETILLKWAERKESEYV